MKKPAKEETKEALIERCRTLIDRNNFHQPFSEADLMEFYEITRVPAKAIRRANNPKFPGDPRHLRMQDFYGSWYAISWNDAIKRPSHISLLKKTLRGEIELDLKDYLAAAKVKKCVRCSTSNNLSVDHVDPPFDDIALEFINLHNGQIDVVAGPSGGGRIIANRDLAAEWIEFHISRATYQILCKPCNSSKGKKVK